MITSRNSTVQISNVMIDLNREYSMHVRAKTLTIKAVTDIFPEQSIVKASTLETILQGLQHLSTGNLYQPRKNNMIGNRDPSHVFFQHVMQITHFRIRVQKYDTLYHWSA